MVCATITIEDDQAFEKDENFTLCLDSEYNVDIDTPEVYAVIESDDGKPGVDWHVPKLVLVYSIPTLHSFLQRWTWLLRNLQSQ